VHPIGLVDVPLGAAQDFSESLASLAACGRCRRPKPPLTHHCSICDKCDAASSPVPCNPVMSETNRRHLVLFGMQNSAFVPCLAAINRILISLVCGALGEHRGLRITPGVQTALLGQRRTNQVLHWQRVSAPSLSSCAAHPW
jgi:hypothetical protein